MRELVIRHSSRFVQALWAALAVAGTIHAIAGVGADWKKTHAICHAAAACSNSQLDAAAARTLSHYGISIDAFAAYEIALKLAVLGMFYGLGRSSSGVNRRTVGPGLQRSSWSRFRWR